MGKGGGKFPGPRIAVPGHEPSGKTTSGESREKLSRSDFCPSYSPTGQLKFWTREESPNFVFRSRSQMSGQASWDRSRSISRDACPSLVSIAFKVCSFTNRKTNWTICENWGSPIISTSVKRCPPIFGRWAVSKDPSSKPFFININKKWLMANWQSQNDINLNLELKVLKFNEIMKF